MLKSYKLRIYPNKKQSKRIDQSIGCCRFIYNQMLAERIEVYEKLKNDKEKLYKYKYKTEKQYKEEFEFLKFSSSRALQQSRVDLDSAYKNFYRNVKQGKKIGFPKFKSKSKVKWSYREPQVDKEVEIKDNKIKLLKLKWVKIKGLNGRSYNRVNNVTITKTRSGKYKEIAKTF